MYPVKYSVVVPIFNEEGSVKELYFSLKKNLDALNQPYEIVLVNDGSSDGGFEVLENLDARPSHLVLVTLKGHLGQSAALQAGFETVSGEIIITMDGDLQNDPDDIPLLLDKINSGYDVVCGWRQKRDDPFHRILMANVAGIIRRAFFKEKVHDMGCTFRAYKRKVIENIHISGGQHRFLTLILSKLGYKVCEVKVRHHRRKFGRSRYVSINRVFEGLRDLATISFCDIHVLMQEKNDDNIKDIKCYP